MNGDEKTEQILKSKHVTFRIFFFKGCINAQLSNFNHLANKIYV